MTWMMLDTPQVTVPIYTVSEDRRRPNTSLRLIPIHRHAKKLTRNSHISSFSTQRNAASLPRESFHQTNNTSRLGYRPNISSQDHSGDHSLTLDIHSHPQGVMKVKPGQRVWKGLSSRRGLQLSPNHFRSAPEKKIYRTECCLSVETKSLIMNSSDVGMKRKKNTDLKVQKRREERLLLAKTKELLKYTLSPGRSVRPAL